MKPDELKEVLRLHGMWLRNEDGGKRAVLSRADLSRAVLSRADLREADLNGAYLSEADLSRADLRGAYLRGAYLSGAYLRGAKGIIRIGPAQDGYEFFAVRRDGAVWIKAGCRWFTAADARAHWQETRPDTPLGEERLRFVDFLETNCPE